MVASNFSMSVTHPSAGPPPLDTQVGLQDDEAGSGLLATVSSGSAWFHSAVPRDVGEGLAFAVFNDQSFDVL